MINSTDKKIWRQGHSVSSERRAPPQPSVSVVMATYNRLTFLKEAVESVLAQTFGDWELLIVDDGSQDGTWDWLAGLRDHRIRVFRLGENAGKSVACNLALAEIAGDFLMILDDDDRLRRDALTKLVEPLGAHPEAVATIGAMWSFREWGHAVRPYHPRRLSVRVIWPELLFGWMAGSGQVLYRAARVKQAGEFCPAYRRAQDREFWLRVARLGPVVLQPSVTLECRVHDGQRLPPNVEEIREKIFRDFIETLPPEERARAERIRESARWAKSGDQEFADVNYLAALACYLKACRAAPSLCLSPLTGRPIFWGIKKSLLHLLS